MEQRNLTNPDLTEETWVCPESNQYHWKPLIPIKCTPKILEELQNGMPVSEIFNPEFFTEGIDYIIPEKWSVIDAIIDQFDEE